MQLLVQTVFETLQNEDIYTQTEIYLLMAESVAFIINFIHNGDIVLIKMIQKTILSWYK